MKKLKKAEVVNLALTMTQALNYSVNQEFLDSKPNDLKQSFEVDDYKVSFKIEGK